MTKIICVGDIHMSDRPPSSATESYGDDLVQMLLWIADYANKIEADAVVWAGDIFHHKQPSRTSHATVLRMIEVVQYYQAHGLDLRIVVGNHDISNDVLDSVREKQPLGVLLESTGATELVGWHESLPLYGVPWQQRWHHEGVVDEAFENWRGEMHMEGNRPRLAVTHAPIIPPSEDKELYETLSVDDIAEAMDHTGFLYYGHIHEDHGIWEHGGVTFANVGALSRGSLTEYNVNRKIQVALWTEEGFTAIEVPHKPASEVLRIEEVMEERGEKLSLDNFLKEVGSSTLDFSSTESVVEHIRKSDVSPRIRKKAIDILEELK